MAGDRIYTAEMGQPPMDPEVAPATKKERKEKPAPEPKVRDVQQHAPIWTEKSGIPVPQEPEVARPVRKAAGGSVSASRRADGIAQRGKTRGRIV